MRRNGDRLEVFKNQRLCENGLVVKGDINDSFFTNGKLLNFKKVKLDVVLIRFVQGRIKIVIVKL